jgi:hypothetical protein
MSSLHPIYSRDQLRLDSWKNIANYLGRSCRTAQRWHATYGLPIRQVGGYSSSVFAYSDELDGWFRERGKNPPESGLNLGDNLRLEESCVVPDARGV